MLLKETSFTIFDFETTGLYPYSGDMICEIGAVRIYPKRKEEVFHSMVDPGRPISAAAFMVNRITPHMLAGAPKIDQILPAFLKFIEGSVLVAYNAGFDIGFFECALGKKKAILDNYHVIDALRLARRLFPDVGRYTLGNVARSLGIFVRKEHRALEDVRMTLGVFRRELEILIASGAERVEDLGRVLPKRQQAIETVRDYKIELIRRAIREQKELNITYHSPWKDEVTKRTITPRRIQKGYDRTYVEAYCHLRKGNRSFLLDGIGIKEAEPK